MDATLYIIGGVVIAWVLLAVSAWSERRKKETRRVLRSGDLWDRLGRRRKQ